MKELVSPAESGVQFAELNSGLATLAFSLATEKHRRFMAMLDATLSHSPGLERLMAVTAPWNTAEA